MRPGDNLLLCILIASDMRQDVILFDTSRTLVTQEPHTVDKVRHVHHFGLTAQPSLGQLVSGLLM